MHRKMKWQIYFMVVTVKLFLSIKTLTDNVSLNNEVIVLKRTLEAAFISVSLSCSILFLIWKLFGFETVDAFTN